MADEVKDKFSWKEAIKIPTKCDQDGFFNAVQVWIEKPHVVNRRLNGSLVIKRVSMPRLQLKVVTETVTTRSRMQDSRGFWERLLDDLSSLALIEQEDNLVEVILRRLLPRQLNRNSPLIELVVLDKPTGQVSFFPLFLDSCEENEDYCSPSKRANLDFEMMPYRITYTKKVTEEARLLLQTLNDNLDTFQELENLYKGDGVVCPSIKWLGEHLLPKLKKWAETPDEIKSKGSLRLIPLEKYTLLYQKMKEKHGERLVKTWPEVTDPQKFVYEDIAIATYLLILWEEEREKENLTMKQSFVDLGCGNGLLVNLLIEEGHPGVGIDVRQRKIWKFFGPKTKLEERPLDPTARGLFPDVDWLIGNHSDELTPWLPVMAARSSYKPRYFVLPCCLFDFNCKFIRTDNRLSQYRGYLDFVRDVGVTCGFHVEEDMLRIPSTKRICQIGRCRTYPPEEHASMEVKIKEMIRKRGCDLDKGRQPQTMSLNLNTTSLGELKVRHSSRVHGEALTIEDTEASLSSSASSSSVSDSKQERTNRDTRKHEHCTCHVNVGAELDFVDNLECKQNLGPRSRNGDDVEDMIIEGTSTSSTNLKDSPIDPDSGRETDRSAAAQVSTDFQPRSSTIVVRNCSTLTKSLKDFMINKVADALLEKDKDENQDSKVDRDKTSFDSHSLTSNGRPLEAWNQGGCLPLSEVANLFDKQTLQQLKKECGGIQTLLRNHRHIFKVVRGMVELRDWRLESPGPKKTGRDPAYLQRRYDALYKTTTCWFHSSHPDGCPYSTEQCPYAHSTDELRERPTVDYLKSL